MQKIMGIKIDNTDKNGDTIVYFEDGSYIDVSNKDGLDFIELYFMQNDFNDLYHISQDKNIVYVGENKFQYLDKVRSKLKKDRSLEMNIKGINFESLDDDLIADVSIGVVRNGYPSINYKNAYTNPTDALNIAINYAREKRIYPYTNLVKNGFIKSEDNDYVNDFLKEKSLDDMNSDTLLSDNVNVNNIARIIFYVSYNDDVTLRQALIVMNDSTLFNTNYYTAMHYASAYANLHSMSAEDLKKNGFLIVTSKDDLDEQYEKYTQVIDLNKLENNIRRETYESLQESSNKKFTLK